MKIPLNIKIGDILVSNKQYCKETNAHSVWEVTEIYPNEGKDFGFIVTVLIASTKEGTGDPVYQPGALEIFLFYRIPMLFINIS